MSGGKAKRNMDVWKSLGKRDKGKRKYSRKSKAMR